jgi:uncharacterized membrane protein YphA (DoxX/SURF4 family)
MELGPLRRMAQFVLGSTFLGAALYKCATIDEFRATIAFLVVPIVRGGDAAMLLAIAVVAWELVLATMLLWNAATRVAAAMTFATLLIFTSALVRLWVSPDAPDCNCGILTAAFNEAQSGLSVALVRNAVLLWLALLSMPPRSGRHRPENAGNHQGIDCIPVTRQG